MRRFSSIRIFAALTTVCCALSLAAQNSEPYYATIVAERIPSAQEALPEVIQATLHINDAERTAATLAGIEGIDVIEHSAGTIDLVFGPQSVMPGASSNHYLGNSFVIDFEEPSVRELAEEIANTHDGAASIDELTEYVFTYIEDKTYSRAFDLASQVASSGAGDCTEHAVLLAALARSQGYPARVVLGVVMIDIRQESRAYGHAWAEIHNGRGWQIADATRPDIDPAVQQVRYLPHTLLDNEGPGYALSLMRSAANMPARISAIGPVR